MTINRSAPVIAGTEIEIEADVETIWNLITGVGDWPSWNPNVEAAAVEGDLAEGSRFRWKAGPGTITSTIERISAPRFIAWSGKTLGIRAIHIHRLQPSGDRTTVMTEESYDGLVVRLFRGRLQTMLDEALGSGLQALKSEAERRVATPRGEPDRPA